MTDTKPEGPYFYHKIESGGHGAGGPGRNPEEYLGFDERGARACVELLNEGYAAGRASWDRLREALESISKNTCCSSCQEAKLVALKALAEDRGPDFYRENARRELYGGGDRPMTRWERDIVGGFYRLKF